MQETKEENLRPTLTELEREVLKWRWEMHGDFYRSVYECIIRADAINLARFQALFPLHVQAYEAWKSPGFAKSLQDKINWIPSLKHIKLI